MGFGTGHHATTRLCLSALQDLDLRGRTVLDVGTGSGVLAIAAARLGAGQVLAIDSDPDASASARENLQLNAATNVSLGAVSLGTTDIRDLTLKPFDVLLANLTGALLVTVAPRLRGLCKGHLVISGLTAPEEPDVLSAFAGCQVLSRTQEDEWVCLTLSSG
jgi:ribosomal protein L11 methyltransferase